MRVSRDGSALLFTLPEQVWPGVLAPAGSGLNILSSVYSYAEHRAHVAMYHFDGQANLQSQNQMTTD
jgi:hypothetical protein